MTNAVKELSTTWEEKLKERERRARLKELAKEQEEKRQLEAEVRLWRCSVVVGARTHSG